MNSREAILLVKDKYLEEQKGITTGELANKYKNACNQYPALMTTAHYIWAQELSKKES